MVLTRRRFLSGSLGAGAGALAGCWPDSVELPPGDAFAGGVRLGVLDWEEADPPRFGRRLGRGWDGRRYTDLRRLDEVSALTPPEELFLRTFAPPGAAADALQVAGRRLPRTSLRPRSQGAVLLECAGNDARSAFGLMGCVHWEGVPLEELLPLSPPRPGDALRVSGRDDHDAPSRDGHSQPGAAWIFPAEALRRAGAFLATGLDGAPLPRDHGAPLRLAVPGWYGCCWIKWVERLDWVGADEPATSQMREFASRTHQRGVPARARDYAPASVDAAALPVRVERWRVGDRTRLRVVGVQWGGSQPASALEIRLGRGARWQPVRLPAAAADARGWRIWEHAWEPVRAGRYEIDCRIPDRSVRQRRLAAGFYRRTLRFRFE